MENQPKEIIVHHTSVSRLGKYSQFYAVNSYHKQRFNAISSKGYFCGYHIFIEPSGLTYYARELDEPGVHTIGHNEKSVAICLAGNFSIEFPTDSQIMVLKRELDRIISIYPIEKIGPHRAFQSGRTCYGTNLSDNWAECLVRPVQKNQLEEDKALAIMRQRVSKIRLMVEAIRSTINKLK